MSNHPDPDDPFEGLPPELRRMMEQLGNSGLFQQLQMAMTQPSEGGPVNWSLARQTAYQVAAEGDRPPSDAERTRAAEALQLAEHWLDASTLPAPPDAGRLLPASRTDWVDAALTAMRPLVEPVAAASTRAMTDLAQQQMEEIDLEAMGLEGLLGNLDLSNLGAMLRPMGATLTGMQAGQVVGELSRQLLGQYELGLPTAPREVAVAIAVNIDEAFAGWELDPFEVAVVLTLHEAAHRRLYHAVPWLEAHVHGLVAQFANGTVVDAEQLQRMAQDLMEEIDPDDPASMQEALGHLGEFRLEPTAAQERVLERLQGVVALVGAWARREVDRAAADRLPNRGRVDEVLRRRRAAKGDGEALLERLLGLDLKPDDEEVGTRFVTAVEQARGPEGLRRALAHPENLPDTEELADPSRWLARMAAGEEVPDDPSALFEGLGDAPVERSADERGDDADEHRDGEGDSG